MEFTTTSSSASRPDMGGCCFYREKHSSASLFFFNPPTREKINLPNRSWYFHAAAFTEPPTCTLFAVTSYSNYKTNYSTFVDILHVGKDKHWNRYFYKESGHKTGVFNNVFRALSCGGKLLCVYFQGEVGIFDENNGGTWDVSRMVDGFEKLQISYLAENKGKIFGGMKAKNGGLYKVFEFKIVNGHGSWTEIEDMDYMVLFLGEYGSLALSGFEGDEVKDRVFVGRDDPQFKCHSKGTSHELGEFGWSYSSVWV